MEELLIDDLDAVGVLAAAGRTVFERRAAEVRDLRLLAQWAVLHGSDPRKDPTASPLDYLVEVGGDGSPRVRDLCLAEIAVVRGVHELSARSALADVLDLMHRLPRVWALVEDLQAEPWLARRAASMSRKVPLEHMGVVDAAIAGIIAGEAPSRVLKVVEAKVIEADPEAHAARVERERRRRRVVFSPTDDCGLRSMFAQLDAPDAVYLEAMVDRLARILQEQHAATATDPSQVPALELLRPAALAQLSRPAEALALLLSHGTDAEALGESRATALPAELLAALRTIDPARLRPQLTLYAHLSAQGLVRPDGTVVRVEDVGPVLLSQLRDLLGERCHVTLKPVVDLAEAVQGTAYEHPAATKERVWLLNGRDTFPFACGTSRRVDFDHVTPFSAEGGEGQTGTHNSQPLSRRSHRRKTHAGFRTTQLGPGRYLWRTPHGFYLHVGPDGTYPVSPPAA